jgi:hypothetical protein
LSASRVSRNSGRTGGSEPTNPYGCRSARC